MTAKEMLDKHYNMDYNEDYDKVFMYWNAQNALIEFAKFHVEAALKKVSKLDFEDINHPKANDYEEALRMTILESYPLDDIK